MDHELFSTTDECFEDSPVIPRFFRVQMCEGGEFRLPGGGPCCVFDIHLIDPIKMLWARACFLTPRFTFLT